MVVVVVVVVRNAGFACICSPADRVGQYLSSQWNCRSGRTGAGLSLGSMCEATVRSAPRQ